LHIDGILLATQEGGGQGYTNGGGEGDCFGEKTNKQGGPVVTERWASGERTLPTQNVKTVWGGAVRKTRDGYILQLEKYTWLDVLVEN